jgi:ketosteroid isomerase-like protein
MSQENVEIVRVFIDAFNQGDLEAAFKHMDSDFEFDTTRTIGLVGGVLKLDQTRSALDEFLGLWEAVHFELDKFVEVGEQVAISLGAYFRGRDGVEVKARPSYVWTMRNGRIVHGCFYQEWQEALEAVGLSEQDAHADF